MGIYAFHFYDLHGIESLSQGIACKDDLDALAEGVRRSDGHAIEIFQGARLVARVKPDNAPLNATDLYSL